MCDLRNVDHASEEKNLVTKRTMASLLNGGRFWSLCGTAVRIYLLYRIVLEAYTIRLFAIETYGKVIHEFDPWFNFRATKYLADNGWTKFFRWFDYKAWYPLGRPIGTTIYPGMQILSVYLWKFLNASGIANMNLNDVCVFVPAWLGATSSLWLGALTAEASGSNNAGVVAAAIYAIIPAHIMRSVGGGYDNESVAMDTMLATFYFWIRSLRDERSWPFGVLTGLAYMCMAATWGGYIFIVNMIAIHCVALVLTGRHSSNLHRAYSLFFVIGTAGATMVPVVGWAPLRNLEQISALLTFVGVQLWELSHALRRRWKLSTYEFNRLRVKIFGVAGLVLACVAYQLFMMGYFGPLGARIRGLFVKHTRTGNPLVDSVAEHQPGSDQAYYQYLENVFYIAPIGMLFSCLRWNRGQLFLVLYGVIAYYFMNKMVRLIVIGGPIASALGGVAIGYVLDWIFAQVSSAFNRNVWTDPPKPTRSGTDSWMALFAAFSETADARLASISDLDSLDDDEDGAPRSNKMMKMKKKKKKTDNRMKTTNAFETFYERARNLSDSLRRALLDVYNLRFVRVLRGAIAFVLILVVVATQLRPSDLPKGNALREMRKNYLSKEWRGWLRKHDYARSFIDYSWRMAEQMSGPSIMFKANLRSGETIIVDDYREAYWWLRDNTPEDARVMAWWDYGYQITGIGERTTIADGNTWNHEHIATLGKALTSEQHKAHKIVRHLADYILIWTGDGGDDLAKSPHMARIGNSVYRDICPGDPTCSKFGFYGRGQPTPMMRESLLYNLHSHNIVPGVQADEKLYREVFKSKFGKVRIFKVLGVSLASKKWVADPANRLCDAEGSWYCPGQYPPALRRLIASRKPFSQLEDFNSGGADREYTEAYMARMEGRTYKPSGDDGSEPSKRKLSKGERKSFVKKLASSGCLYADVSYVGKNSERFTAKDVIQCMERCEKDFTCEAWSYKRSSRLCRLKLERGRLVFKPGMISGAVECGQDDVENAKRLKANGQSPTAKDSKERKSKKGQSNGRDASAEAWMDTDKTTALYEMIRDHRTAALEDLLEDDPEVAFVRSKDGRGPLFWAYEHGHEDIARLLLAWGADPAAKDKKGRVAGEK